MSSMRSGRPARRPIRVGHNGSMGTGGPRRPQRPDIKKPGGRRSIWLIIVFVLLILGGLVFGYVGAAMSSLPDVANVQPAASSEIYDADGNLITTVHSAENRIPVPLSQIPKNLQNAFIATEDSRFYSHHGIDPIGVLRAIAANIMHEGIAEGGSTITQQLARNAFLTQDQTLKRKIMEALLAIEIERHYTKQEILDMYLNQIYFGQGAYGVQAAAHVYFGKDVKDLDLQQCAMLAGLPQSPNYYSPFNNLAAGKKRQAEVLGQMVKYGYISQGTADEAKNADLGLVSKPESVHSDNNASYFVDYIIAQVSKKYGDDAIYKDGMKIYTTLNMKDQDAAVKAMQNLPNMYTDKKGLEQPQGALVAINPHNGYIVAMVGGRGNDSFNRAVLAERQPGSAFKPFVYLAALEDGMTPDDTIDDKPVDFNGWKPQNYERNYSGTVTLRYALAHSINVPAVELADKVGMNKILDLAKSLGISTLVTEGTPNDDNLAAAIGGLTHGVTPLDMAVAYAAIDNGGVKVNPIAITKIVDRNGQVIEENTTEEKRVVDAKYAYMLTSMLESVITNGTGGNAAIGRPAAGKTGTTDDSKDAWFVGYTPNLVCAVWMGDDYGTHTLDGLTGGTVPAQIWHDFMSAALADTPVANFTVPDGMQSYEPSNVQAPSSSSSDDSSKDTDKKDKSKKQDAVAPQEKSSDDTASSDQGQSSKRHSRSGSSSKNNE